MCIHYSVVWFRSTHSRTSLLLTQVGDYSRIYFTAAFYSIYQRFNDLSSLIRGTHKTHHHVDMLMKACHHDQPSRTCDRTVMSLTSYFYHSRVQICFGSNERYIGWRWFTFLHQHWIMIVLDCNRGRSYISVISAAVCAHHHASHVRLTVRIKAGDAMSSLRWPLLQSSFNLAHTAACALHSLAHAISCFSRITL